ncbi:MAG: hypothetical protein ACK5LO_05155 [Leucobacter sp.]
MFGGSGSGSGSGSARAERIGRGDRNGGAALGDRAVRAAGMIPNGR